MQDNSSTDIGAQFRTIRTRRHLRIKQLATSLSETTISRFERGQLDLTVSKLMPLLEAAEVSPDELLTPSTRAQRLFNAAIHDIVAADANHDTIRANKVMSRYLQDTGRLNLPLNKFNVIILKNFIAAIDDPYRYMDQADQEAIVQLLTASDDWYFFEFKVLANSIYYLSADNVVRCINMLQRNYAKTIDTPKLRELYASILMFAVYRLLETKNYEQANKILAMADALKFSAVDLIFSYRLAVFHAALNYLENPNAASLAPLTTILTGIKLIAPPDFYADEVEFFVSIGIPC